MIELGQLTAAICAHIHGKTGVFAIDERLKTAVYPSVYVDATEKSTDIAAGGRQVLRKIGVRLHTFPGRERERDEARELAHAVYGALLPWFPACGRRLVPLDLALGGDGCEITFGLEFYDLPPTSARANTSMMNSISLALGQGDIPKG